jgi:hypothetical protein
MGTAARSREEEVMGFSALARDWAHLIVMWVPIFLTLLACCGIAYAVHGRFRDEIERLKYKLRREREKRLAAEEELQGLIFAISAAITDLEDTSKDRRERALLLLKRVVKKIRLLRP